MSRESYAGSIDLICQDEKGDFHLWDFKTGGHETVDYQLSLYKRAFCKNRNIDPERVHLHCIDAKNEDRIKDFEVRNIAEKDLDRLLECYRNGEHYSENAIVLAGISDESLVKLESFESYITSLEAEIKTLSEQKEQLEEDLYNAMEDAGIESFDFGSVHAKRVLPTTAETFDSKSFKADHPELHKAYLKVQNRKGYLKITVKDLTEASK